MKLCKKCGKEIEDHKNFCPRCGHSVFGDNTANQKVYIVKKTKPGKGFGITSLVLGIIGLVLSVWIKIRIIWYIYSIFNDDSNLYYTGLLILLRKQIFMRLLVVTIISLLSFIFGMIAYHKYKYREKSTNAGIMISIISLTLLAFSALFNLLNYLVN